MTKVSGFVEKYCDFEQKMPESSTACKALAVDILKFAKYHTLDLRREFCGMQGVPRYEKFSNNLNALANKLGDQKTKDKIAAILVRVRPPQTDPLIVESHKPSRQKIASDPLFGIRLLYQLALEKAFYSAPSKPNPIQDKEIPCVLNEIENLVISGGGAKGVMLLGAFRELFKKAPQFMNQIKGVAGSSVGAITAAMLATGISRETMLEIGGVDIEALLGKELLGKSGNNLIYFVRQCIRINILLRLSEMDEETKERFEKTDPKMAERIKDELRKPVQDASITFAMLAYLNKIDPQHFKELHITATEKEKNSLFIFSSEKTPDVDIADACRASASIPVVFKPVQMEIGNEKRTFYDGGVIDNVPVQIFEDKNTPSNQTMVFVFEKPIADGDLSAFDPARPGDPYKSSRIGAFLRGPALRFFTGIELPRSSAKYKEDGLRKVKKDYSNTTVSLPSDLGTTSFKKASENGSKYFQVGKSQMQGYLEEPRTSAKDVSAIQKANPAPKKPFKERCFSVFKEAMSNFIGTLSFPTLDISLFSLMKRTTSAV